ncbi:glycosyltransferase [Ectobacillus antri]|jgi:glycosyltransferase involved in cell wall biosynthesis|uniref:Glycosyltransferase n=1 Tax=Ectobacillus antri TaxID=2486280 RepID=A0ABT6H987_9BACI|nr:glycosyltransferase [Ectobacillus antri]MDG4658128.1 glycosyltransferase [Ectobacillus antri]MDG5754926.1 glycosyltransferase [Ectobacillus antri]
MSKKVCMFVWNHFTNDARVLRECTALTEAGYEVDLIAIHDWKNEDLLKKEQRPEGFTVYRVNNKLKVLPKIFGTVKRVKRLVLKNVMTKAVTAVFVLLALWKLFVPTMLLLFAAMVLSHPKIGTLFLRASIATQMVIRGMQKSYDIYHSNDLNTLPQGIVCAKLLRRRKLVYDSHEVQTSRTGYDSKIYGIMEKLYLQFIDVMIAENHTRAKYNEELYGFYPEVVHNYPFVTRPENSSSVNLHEMLHIPKEEPILLYQGGIQSGRGLEKVVQAVPLIKRGVVVFIGDGRIKPDLERLVDEMKIHDRVKFLSKVPVEQLPHYTKNAYLGFQVLNNTNFNHYSASSNKLFEYMMSGIPVVACSFPEIQRVVEGEHTGVCIDSHDPVSIAEGVNYLLDHPDEREQMRQNAFRAREKYNWENEKKVFLGIYQRMFV